jgi:hypothetical protein
MLARCRAFVGSIPDSGANLSANCCVDHLVMTCPSVVGLIASPDARQWVECRAPPARRWTRRVGALFS